jgi:hypothetical protein
MAQLSKAVRAIGWVWVVLAPIIFGMAAISTVRSVSAYYAQLAAFSAVALAALVFGLSAAFGAVWARRGLLSLSWLGCIYFCGSSVLMVAYTAVDAFQTGGWPGLLFLAVVVSTFALGVPFYLMVKALRWAAIHDPEQAA